MFTHFFINRPIAATVLSIVVVVMGLVARPMLPIAQYPEVAPPSVQVSAIYPGANAKVVAETVATPIEQEVNGVENMLYMTSKCTNDGQMFLDITFKLGTDLNQAQVLVQNRVAIAEAKLPEEVRKQGVTTKKKSPSILLCVNLISAVKKDPITGVPVLDSQTGKPTYQKNQLYLSNYATIQIKDALARIAGVGDVTFIGPRDYSMRIWLDPTKLASRNLTANDVLQALKEQNIQVAAGRIGQPPVSSGLAFQLTINTQGRLAEEDQFADVIIKTERGKMTYLKDVVKKKDGIELGAKNYDVNSYLDGEPSVTLAVFQLPGSNALKTADAIKAEMKKLKDRFPPGMDYRIVYDTTVFVEESISAVFHTLIEAFVLVFVVVLVFLQNWRATIVPMIAVPVSLVGTFAAMAGLGFSLNNLSLFGLVLAIGIVVDDAIVVVENVERYLSLGFSPKEAAHKAMDEVTGPVIAVTLVMAAVFIPTAFLAGITGQFFRQFALTIAASTIISAFNSLTLSPALCALLLKGHGAAKNESASEGHGHTPQEALPRLGIVVIAALLANLLLAPLLGPWFGIEVGHGHGASDHPADPLHVWSLRLGLYALGGVAGWFLSGLANRGLASFFKGFNWTFDRTITGYGNIVTLFLRTSLIVVVVYLGLVGLTGFTFQAVPTGFIPEQDKGYLIVNAQLPEGSSLERTEEVIEDLTARALKTEGVGHTIGMPGYSALLGVNISNVGGMFVILKPFDERAGHSALSAKAVAANLRQQVKDIQEARVVVFGAPPIDGLGSTGGFKMQIQDRGGSGDFRVLQGTVENLVMKGNKQPDLIGLFSSFRADQPQLFVDINRKQAKALDIDLAEIFSALQVNLGSAYVNDFTNFGRNWQVNVQADSRFRARPEDIGKLKVRNKKGQMVPLAVLIDVRYVTGPSIVNHYNMYTSAELSGNPAPGSSSGEAIDTIQILAKQELPSNMGFEWTELTYQQILAEMDPLSPFIFPLCVLLVFLTLAFQYESWSLPFAIILIVPMSVLCALVGVWLNGLANDIFTQIGLVVLIGLAAKNAILIVEFAKNKEDAGEPVVQATVDAATQRLRPILMTSFAFILGVVPLVLATGAGAEMRQALGIAVFSGMLGVTIFGIFLTPVFYLVIRKLTARRRSSPVERVPAKPEA